MGKKGFDLAALAREAMGADAPVSELDTVQEISAARITPNAANFYEMTDLEELAASIELVGLMTPIQVKPAGVPLEYVIIDGERRFRALTQVLGRETVPCIVRTPLNDVIEELMLIEANRTQRRMSPADLSRQAERYTELLSRLRDAGVEIPGRLRDRVAEALDVSASKLGRLHAIREKLEPGLLALFDDGELNESVAYELSRFDQQKQLRVVDELDPLEPRSLTADMIRLVGAADDRRRPEPEALPVSKSDTPDPAPVRGREEEAQFRRLLIQEGMKFFRIFDDVEDRHSAIEYLKRTMGHRGWGGPPYFDCSPSGLTITRPGFKTRRTWAEVYDILCSAALQLAAQTSAPDAVSHSDTPPGLEWHDTLVDGPPPEDAMAVIFWTPDHGFVFPPSHLIWQYIKTMPEMTTYWAVVTGPKD